MMSRFFEGICELLFPGHVACILCGEEAVINEKGLCADCERSICRCVDPLPLHHASGFTAGLLYEGITTKGIQRLKYGDARFVAPFLASCIEIPEEWKIDLIVPIPLHWLRLWKRGYNQSTLLAAALSGRIGVPVAEKLLRRNRYTKTQTAFGAAQRVKNIRGAFTASPDVKGKHILLVDDVRTTGATLDTAAKALLDAGAKTVYACAACETKRD